MRKALNSVPWYKGTAFLHWAVLKVIASNVALFFQMRSVGSYKHVGVGEGRNALNCVTTVYGRYISTPSSVEGCANSPCHNGVPYFQMTSVESYKHVGEGEGRNALNHLTTYWNAKFFRWAVLKALRLVIVSNGIPYLQMRSVGSHSTSDLEREGMI